MQLAPQFQSSHNQHRRRQFDPSGRGVPYLSLLPRLWRVGLEFLYKKMHPQVRVAMGYQGKTQSPAKKYERHINESIHLQLLAPLSAHALWLSAIHHFQFDELLELRRRCIYLLVPKYLSGQKFDHQVVRALQMHIRLLDIHGSLHLLCEQSVLHIGQFRVAHAQHSHQI